MQPVEAEVTAMERTERDASPPPSAGPADDAAALLRLEHALEVIGAHCASIGRRLLRARVSPRRA